jgi:cellulose synthase/poly-beta-1,6-N-acetylglucosamine synthase-like glycosyltransferase
MRELIYGVLVLVSVLVIIQSAHTLYLTLYTWDRPPAEARAPESFLPPRLSFTVMIPARHEEAVIQTTIERFAEANYPPDLIQILVICSEDDQGTINKAEQKITELQRKGLDNVSMVVFSDGPISKPHGLNAALPHAVNNVVSIFDAEDDIHPDLFNVVNTVMEEEQVKVVQAGVQLMNFDSSWYSALNVLEYFFWFKSRLHYHARRGAIPLGGNTVFFDRLLITRLGGWDENCLAEDADIGLRLSAEAGRIRVVYDDRYVTKEETPPTIGQFIRQRTRWNQGFMQVLKKGTWKNLPTRRQRWLAFYTLAFPHAQAFLGIYVIFSLTTMFTFKAPVLVAIISFLPVLMFLAHLVLSIVGLYEFAGAHGLTPSRRSVFRLVIGWLPYQLMLSYAAMRAVSRQMRGIRNWEKTQHTGVHRARVDRPADMLKEANEHAA